MCNIIEEANSEIENGAAGEYTDRLKQIIFQEPLPSRELLLKMRSYA
jgi:hypothetical protein